MDNELKEIRGMSYFNLALWAFASLSLDLILFLIEPYFYGQDVSRENWTAISHWSIICILWLIATFYILRYAKKRYNFKLTNRNDNVKLINWILVLLILALQICISYESWGGFKIVKEFNNLGKLHFTFQYMYYFVETLLFLLIIIFGQKACEVWFRNENIPYGGIVCALTWGLVHIFSKGSVVTGLLAAVAGFGFGSTYVLLNKDASKAFPIVFLMFVL